MGECVTASDGDDNNSKDEGSHCHPDSKPGDVKRAVVVTVMMMVMKTVR
jgi:hypothetical protein